MLCVVVVNVFDTGMEEVISLVPLSDWPRVSDMSEKMFVRRLLNGTLNLLWLS